MRTCERSIREGKDRYNQENENDTSYSSPDIFSKIVIISKGNLLSDATTCILIFKKKYYLVNAEYNSNDEIVVNKVIVCGL